MTPVRVLQPQLVRDGFVVLKRFLVSRRTRPPLGATRIAPSDFAAAGAGY